MDVSTVSALPADSMIGDADFDLVIGELEQDAPKSKQDIGTCHRIYCFF